VPAHLVQRGDAAGIPGDVDTSSSGFACARQQKRGSSTAAALGGERGMLCLLQAGFQTKISGTFRSAAGCPGYFRRPGEKEESEHDGTK
jgi:hypothetical protein